MKLAALWDMDGTLIDSEEYHWRAWRETMAGEDIAIAHEQFLATFGQRNDAILPHWLGADATAADIQRIGDAKEALYRELLVRGGVKPLPGVAEWLQRLRADCWMQAIASSAPRANVEAVIHAAHFDGCFQAILSAEDVHRGKPDPEVFLAAASRLEVPPAQCVVVEDAAAGIEAARRAGTRSIGVSRKTKLAADIYVRSLEELPPDAFVRLLLPELDHSKRRA